MKKIKITNDRRLSLSSISIGYQNENNAETIKFEIPEEYQEFSKVACFKTSDGTFKKTFDDLTSDYLTLTSDITKYSEADMSIEFIDNANSIVARTSILHLIIENTITDDGDVKPDDPQVIILNELIDEVSKLDITSEKIDTGINVTFTSKTGEKTVRILTNGADGKDGIDGKDGQNGTNGTNGIDGKDATINGVNILNILAGDNIQLSQEESNLTISAKIPEDISPIILGADEILALHGLNPRMGTNQIFCESLYEKYGDALFYVNSNFYMSNSTEDVSDTNDFVGIGSTIIVSNMGKSMLAFSTNWNYNLKYFRCINTYADANSKYNLVNLTTDQLYNLLDNIDNVLTTDNTKEYEPTTDYNPATKTYVDTKIIAERSIYYAEIFDANWYDSSVLQPILDLAYKGEYDDVFIKIKDGTRYIQCAGLSLQDLTTSSNTTLMWANLKYITGSSTTPNTIFYGYACANGVKLDENGDVAITSTGLKNGSVKVMKDADQITGYDKTKTQVLKNVSGTLQWISE